jgi:hypothetical protein
MKPKDALPGDRRRYFDQGWMWDTKKDMPVFVRYTSRAFTAYESPEHRGRSCTLSQLEPWYPEGRCINSYNMGICVSRRPRQTARRTASICHYEVAFAPPQKRLIVDNRVMWDLINTDEYPSYNRALERLERGVPSVAISEHLLLYKREDELHVLWHENHVGLLEDGLFVPEFESSCYTKLARLELMEVAPECL